MVFSTTTQYTIHVQQNFLYHSAQILSYISIYAGFTVITNKICRSTCSLLLVHRFLNMTLSVIHIFLCTLKCH